MNACMYYVLIILWFNGQSNNAVNKTDNIIYAVLHRLDYYHSVYEIQEYIQKNTCRQIALQNQQAGVLNTSNNA